MFIKAIDANDEIAIGRELGRQLLSDITNTIYTYTYNTIEQHSDSLDQNDMDKLLEVLIKLNKDINEILPFPEYQENVLAYEF
jgi:hypothetical protein